MLETFIHSFIQQTLYGLGLQSADPIRGCRGTFIVLGKLGLNVGYR